VSGSTVRLSLFLAVAVIGGCDAGKSEDAEAAIRRDVPHVALLHPGRENDRGWNQLAYEALLRLRETTGAIVQHTHTPNRTTFKSEMRDYARRGFTLVICHGSEYVKAARQVAPAFPATRFVICGSSDAGDGVTTLDFRLWEATYLCGVLAAGLAPESPIGLIGGEDIVTVRNTMDAFANGARSVSPRIGVYPQYVGSWDDVARARQTAQSLIETRGVRALFQNIDAAAMGVFQAAAEARVHAFGCNSNQNAVMPEVIPASAVINMERAFALALEAANRPETAGEVIVCDMAIGAIDVVLNPTFSDKWPAGAIENYERARADMVAGRIDVLAASAPTPN
jgi:basic membrane protein A